MQRARRFPRAQSDVGRTKIPGRVPRDPLPSVFDEFFAHVFKMRWKSLRPPQFRGCGFSMSSLWRHVSNRAAGSPCAASARSGSASARSPSAEG